MHGLIGLAGLLVLIGLAFGPVAAMRAAQTILAMGAAVALWVAYLIVFDRI